MSDYLEHSTIKESPSDLNGSEMIQHVLSDYRILLEKLTNVLDHAIDAGDSGTEDMVKSIINSVEKNHWMWTAFSASS